MEEAVVDVDEEHEGEKEEKEEHPSEQYVEEGEQEREVGVKTSPSEDTEDSEDTDAVSANPAESESEVAGESTEEASNSLLLKRKDELLKDIAALEDEIALAVENDDFDKAAELDEEVGKKKAELESIGD